MKSILTLMLGLTLLTSCTSHEPEKTPLVDGMGISVSLSENREFSFTDKWSGYFYGRTHGNGDSWFSGWNISTRRMFSDYEISVNGTSVNRSIAEVVVYPHQLKRTYPTGTETLEVFDHRRVILISFEGKERSIGFRLIGNQFQLDSSTDSMVIFQVPESQLFLAIAPKKAVEFQWQNGQLISESPGGWFVLADSTRSGLHDLLEGSRLQEKQWRLERKERMENLLRTNVTFSGDSLVDLSLKWNLLSLDALITKQTGTGIYAGLPWFNDYWARDMFISLPGATLVTGQLSVARQILMDFAQFQNKDGADKTVGRVPNRVRPDEIIYNTTDGTPRFVVALMDYINYSGDTSLVRELYPVIKRSIDGPIRYWVDEKGYLAHDDADTWMDAKKDGKMPFSPRGNRANDIQALWAGQLEAGILFAQQMGEEKDVERWTLIYEKLRSNFLKDFIDEKNLTFADRIKSNGKKDWKFRPNQLFAYEFIPTNEVKWKMTRKAWEGLVYPWGVASLHQDDPQFHPYHEIWSGYREGFHKDEAYHNGTVWIWNNGIAMQRMIEAGQVNSAYELLRTMSKQTVTEGAVGALDELTNALPISNEKMARRSGTFSQAWSSAELLRVWAQHVLGVQPLAIKKTVNLVPALPDSLSHIDFELPLFSGHIKGSYRRADKKLMTTWVGENIPNGFTATIQIFGFPSQIVPFIGGEKIKATVDADTLSISILSKSGSKTFQQTIVRSSENKKLLEVNREIFKGVKFQTPFLNEILWEQRKKSGWKPTFE